MLLTQQELKTLFSYDPETGLFTRLVQTAPQAKVGTVAGTLTPKGYLSISIRGKNYRVHRLAFLYMTGEWPKVIVDHYNGKPADNSWNNLRPADYSQNGCNSRLRHSSRSGYKGVSYYKDKNRYRAEIYLRDRRYSLGYFKTAEEAHEAYCKKAEVLHGQFANFGSHEKKRA
ncbi:MAG: HNH endonuclease [Pedobacter sp.]|nr:MAG: HNH endonuclease [Pedobacter sp.]